MTTSLSPMTTVEARALFGASEPVAILQPVGSVEPHGPHLPLGTDTIISEAAAEQAAHALTARGIAARVAPAIPYGVTDFAAGFAGAISVPAAALTAFLREIVRAHLTAGAAHVCLVNNHLEPAHDAAVRAAIVDFERSKASVACPLDRRWARTLDAEFKSGACHAGSYETSLVMAAAPTLVREEARRALEPVPISLSTGIKAGLVTFLAMGLEEAYAGDPASASSEHGHTQLTLLAAMVEATVFEALRGGGDDVR
ncbi:MAG: creatininase family protein [Polyangiaceae bacterium]